MAIWGMRSKSVMVGKRARFFRLPAGCRAEAVSALLLFVVMWLAVTVVCLGVATAGGGEGGSRKKSHRGFVVNSPWEAKCAADYLILTPSRFVDTLLPLARHRTSQGHRVAIVTLESLARGKGDEKGGEAQLALREVIRRFVRFVYHRWPQPKLRFVLLVGEVLDDQGALAGIPTWQVRPSPVYMKRAEPGMIASDNPYACIDDKDELPDVALGRIPVRDEKSLAVVVSKVIRYERDSPCGRWRQKICFVTGKGGFGEQADRALALMFTHIVQRCVPGYYDIELINPERSSLYFYPHSLYSHKVAQMVSDGCLALVYVGHGSETYLAVVAEGDQRLAVCASDFRGITVRRGLPVMVAFACLTACLDYAKGPCLGEQLLALPGGPVAFIGSTRVAEPYAMALLGKELITTVLRKRTATIGEAFLKAKRLAFRGGDDEATAMINLGASVLVNKPRLLPGLRRNMVHMFHLLGDPALRLCFVRHYVKLRPHKRRIKAGETLKVGVVVRDMRPPLKGVITLETPRSMVHRKLLSWNVWQKGWEQKAAENCRRANDKVLLSKQFGTEQLRFEVELPLPEGLSRGEYLLKCFLSDGRKEAAGSSRVKVTGLFQRR